MMFEQRGETRKNIYLLLAIDFRVARSFLHNPVDYDAGIGSSYSSSEVPQDYLLYVWPVLGKAKVHHTPLEGK